jgi:hypothetical protein
MDMSELFDSETRGDALDEQLVTAGALLEKLASDVGVDVASLDDQTVAGYLAELMPQQPQTKTASEEPTTMTNQITHADVFAELAKVAAAEGVDLSKLSSEGISECFDAVAAQMASPEYGKVSEARSMGHEMAVGFAEKMDSLQKEAAYFPGKDVLHAAELSQALGSRGVSGRAHYIADLLGSGAKHNIGAGDLSPAVLRLAQAQQAVKNTVNAGLEGYGVHGDKIRAGAAGVGLLGLGAGAHHMATKKSAEEAFNDAVVNYAADMLKSAGIDPSTGEKVSAEQIIHEAAVDLLREKGYEI